MLPLVPVKQSDPEPIDQGMWLKLEQVKFKDRNGTERTWERCVRAGSRGSSQVDAVDIHVVLKTPEPHLILVIQYRPAIERYCIEFPSGLVDEGEDPVDAAVRELKEETGYQVERSKIRMHPAPVSYEPGLTSSCCLVAQVTLETQDIHPNAVAPCLEPDEWSLQTVTLPLKGLLGYLMELVSRSDGQLIIDSRLHAYAAGLTALDEYMTH